MSGDDAGVPAYIARKSCGCVVAAVADDGEDSNEVAKSLAAWVRKGYAVERVTVGWVREHGFDVPCPHESQQARLL